MVTLPTRTGEFLISESAENLSRNTVTVASGQGALAAGTVLGRVTKRYATAPIPTIVGTGTGTMSGLKFGPDVQVGSYVITLTETSATAAFTVVAPDGTSLPNGAVATAYRSNHLSFTIANAGTMTLGDKFTVVVSAAGTPVLVGTGTGTVSGVSLGKYARPGSYKVRLTATSATALFEVVAPDGDVVGTGNVATAFTSDHINFTLANGGTMTLGDYFIVIVAGYTSPEAKVWDPTAVDGTNEAYGILLAAVDATSAAQSGVAITRNAEVNASLLAWKTTVTAAQKTEAYRQLAVYNLIVRS
jgi:hypothetical protein